jgi:hypothetical protein
MVALPEIRPSGHLFGKNGAGKDEAGLFPFLLRLGYDFVGAEVVAAGRGVNHLPAAQDQKSCPGSPGAVAESSPHSIRTASG